LALPILMLDELNVVTLIAGLVLTTLTGLAAQSVHGLKAIRELVADATLCLVPLYLLEIAVPSFQHHENQVRGTIDGYKRT
jgi:hypothetical protein